MLLQQAGRLSYLTCTPSLHPISSLQRLVRTINNRGFPPPETAAAADGAGTSQQAPLGPLQAHAATLSMPAMANTPGSELNGWALGYAELADHLHRVRLGATGVAAMCSLSFTN